MSTALANSLLMYSTGKTPGISTPTNTYLDWLTVALTMPAGSGATAVTTTQVTSYARTTMAPTVFASASSGSIATNTQLTSPLNTAGTGATVVGAGVYDALTAGNVFWGIAVTSFSYGVNVQPVINSGALTLSIS